MLDNALSALNSLLFKGVRVYETVGYNSDKGTIELTRGWFNGMRINHETFEIGLFTVARDVHRARSKDLRLIMEWARKKSLANDYSDGCPRILLRKLHQIVKWQEYPLF